MVCWHAVGNGQDEALHCLGHAVSEISQKGGSVKLELFMESKMHYVEGSGSDILHLQLS